MTGEQVRKLRMKLGLTQSQFADKVGYKRLWISLVENGWKPVPRRMELEIKALRKGKKK